MFLHFIDSLFTLVQKSQSDDTSDVTSHHSRIAIVFTLNVYIRNKAALGCFVDSSFVHVLYPADTSGSTFNH